ncbi:phosphotransferase family protein [Plantibacter cousiniae (nom. nud.)]|uniref:Predicted kinase, aminoglycoside phosphotransferase (APT) family n=1 Tax=Plantibacter cousiniae (nom. nud.) TaxID=199709 RepID=A0ABY1LFS1_9MICO|nr:aminoglycoside phosphotransferase family protein [Plantibacter cousiniae]SKC36156.1 Predicted kinase, aminoglycoside phosphotransferase (APT) family [Plantibacter cousiniae]
MSIALDAKLGQVSHSLPQATAATALRQDEPEHPGGQDKNDRRADHKAATPYGERVIDGWSKVSEALATEVVAAARAPWGRKNSTHILTLADGRKAVWQQYADRHSAAARGAAIRLFGRPGVHLPLEVPTLLAESLDEREPWAVLTHLSGEVGYVAAGDDLLDPVFPHVAADMGNAIRAVQALRPTEFPLPDTWAEPASLGMTAETWLEPLEPFLTHSQRMDVRNLLAELPALFEGRPVVVAHGDFGPQNVLIRDGRVTGLLDFEDARLADPLLDVAWWAWLVRAHTPAAFERSWHRFLVSAEVDPAERDFRRRTTTLIICRLLETAEHFRVTQAEKFPSWADRLATTLEWPPDALTTVKRA